MMPSPNGAETLEAIRLTRPSLEVVIVTAFFDSRLMDEALELGPLTILKKPVEKEALKQVVSNVAAARTN
jgi:DNA-binding NarL/FixJ family response regulator